MDKEKMYKYKVGLYAEGSVEGYVKMTKAEAERVWLVTNPDNWEIINDGCYHGCFEIDIDNPIEVK